MKNRFLFLEKELSVFNVKKTDKNLRRFANSKSNYSRQQIAPAAAAVVVAGVGVGWTVFSWLADKSEGDIKVKLAKLEGAKYPRDDDSTKNRIWKTQTKRVKAKHTNYLGDEISATIDLRFEYNDYGVADIDMDLYKVNDAVGWGLDVETKIMPNRNAYVSKKGGQNMAMVEVTFNYRFNRSIGSDKIVIMRYKLYGDGTVIVK